MNKTKQIIAAIIAFLLFGAGGFWVYSSNNDSQSTDSTTQESTQQVNQDAETEETASTTHISYEGVSDKIALDLLKENYEVTTQDSDFGEFVTSINGTQADSSKEYWSFYVNGEYANEGAGTYQTTEGELIEWKLEKLN